MKKTNNPITELQIEATKDDKRSVLKRFKRFLVEKYASLSECNKNVRKAMKKAKTEHFHGKIIAKKKSGEKDVLENF